MSTLASTISSDLLHRYPIAPDENQRLTALISEKILDTQPDPRIDQLVQIAATLMETPIALVSLVDADRQWFKAKVGLDMDQMPREQAFCSYTILSDQPLIVQDAAQDNRFNKNLLVVGPPYIRFYAGVPITTREGYRLGSLCVKDSIPRAPTAAQLQALRALADITSSLMVTYRQLEAAYDRLLDVYVKKSAATLADAA